MKDQYNTICGMLDDLKESLKFYEETVDASISDTYGLDTETVRGRILELDKEHIKDLTEDEIMHILGCTTIEELESLKHEIHQEDKSNIEYGVYVITAIKEQLDTLVDMRNDYIKLEKEKADLAKEYLNYINSPEYKEERMRRIKKLEEDYESETDVSKKYMMKKSLDGIKALNSLSFLFRGFDRRPEIEKQSALDSFFDSKKGAYVMNKYERKCKSLKIRPEVFRDLLNIEELFLPEEYHVFNNLFLFFSIRYIAFLNTSNVNERAFGTTLIGNMIKLKHNQFQIQEEREYFIQVIIDVISYFRDEYSRFESDNRTHPNHPDRMGVQTTHEDTDHVDKTEELDENLTEATVDVLA